MCVFGDKHQDIITTYPCVNLENQSPDKLNAIYSCGGNSTTGVQGTK